MKCKFFNNKILVFFYLFEFFGDVYIKIYEYFFLQMVEFWLYLCMLVLVRAEEDPFDMFTIETNSVDNDHDLRMGLHKNDSKYTTMGHYRELHKVLVRVLLSGLSLRESSFEDSVNNLEINLNVMLSKQDIEILSQYCNSNETSRNKISPDAVNHIFSRAIRFATIVKPYDFLWRVDYFFTVFICFSFVCVVLVIYYIRFKYILIMSIVLIFFGQSFYQNYNSKLAKKMAVLSRYNGPPQHCKPVEQHSWIHMIGQFFSSRPSSDECASYYEHVLTDPFFATHLYEVFLELVFQFPVHGLASMGKGVGLLYDNLLVYVPFYFAAPIFILSTVFSILVLIFLCYTCLYSSRVIRCNKRKEKSKIKSKLNPSLKSS